MPPAKVAKPATAKVASPKKPSKKKIIGAAVQKRVGEKLSKGAPSDPVPKDGSSEPTPPEKKRSLVKPPYNHRVRSLCRSIVDQVESEVDRKKVRLDLRDLTELSQVRSYVDTNVGEGQFDPILEGWFAAGILGSDKA